MKMAAMVSVILLSGAVAVAQEPDLETQRRAPEGDPSEVVCVTEAEIGSRLARRRVCRTRAEWAEFRLQTRQAVEKGQFDKQTNWR